MADNVTAPGTGTVFASDDVSGVQYPRVKLAFGADGSAADVTTSNALPVALDAASLAALETITAGLDAAATAQLGSLTETAPNTDIASAGLNGRLQRIAQRLTSLIALVPGALANGRFKVALRDANDIDIGTSGNPVNVTVVGGGAGDASAAKLPVYTPGVLAVASANFTRPATTPTYTVGALVANNATAASVVPLSFTIANRTGEAIRLNAATLRNSSATLSSASFRLHLFAASTIPTVGDTGTFNNAALLACTLANYLGFIDITCSASGSDGKWGRGGVVGPDIICAPGSTTLFGLLEARAAYVGVSAEVFTAGLEFIRPA